MCRHGDMEAWSTLGRVEMWIGVGISACRLTTRQLESGVV